ncbi:MAG: dephospho-CoA kinase, partial [Planctomycetes bacterium]|nr:dephospho-CoA kinase [Planctomycetota bacterium]
MPSAPAASIATVSRAFGVPVIGLVGGVGSGKSELAGIFRSEGCEVSDSDRLSHEALLDPAIASSLRARWGDRVLSASGACDRRRIAEIVFSSESDRRFLEALIHPWIAARREAAFAAAPAGTRALVIDAPLLLEAG